MTRDEVAPAPAVEKVTEAPAEDVARLRARKPRAFKPAAKPKTKTKKVKKPKGRTSAKKPAGRAPKANPGAQVCLSFREGFYGAFEKERARIKDPAGKPCRPAKGKRPADLAWTGSRGKNKVRAISRSLLVEHAFAAWRKSGRKVPKV